MGSMSIPALKLDVAIMNQDDSDSLLRGVGHIQGTALPGGLGTVGLAGHRDTFLRPLKNIARGMEIQLRGTDGMYRYVVDRTEIVEPDEVSVLSTKNVPELVLVTCYPFYFVGSAPKRFIVHAHLVSLVPE